MKNTSKLGKQQLFFIGGRDIILSRHSAHYFQEGRRIYVYHNGVQIMERIDLTKLALSVASKDYAVYRFGSRVPARRSSIHHFVTRQDLGVIFRPSLTVHCVNLHDMKSPGTIHRTEGVAHDVVKYTIDDEKVLLRDLFTYKITSVQVGHSGSPVLLHNTRVPHKILGLHSAWDESTTDGYLTVVDQESLYELVKTIDERVGACKIASEECFNPEILDNEVVAQMDWFPQGDCVPLGVLRPELSPSSMERTDFRRSPIHGVAFPPATRPPLTRSEIVNLGFDPMRKQVEKYCYPTIPWAPQDVKRITQNVDDIVLNALRPQRIPILLPLEENIKGNPSFRFMQSINMNSSPGYPDVIWKKGKGKMCMFEENGELTLAAKTSIGEREFQAAQGKRVESLWLDCKKDARVANEKCEAGKCRAFVIGNFSFLILVRKYFGDFMTAWYDAHLNFFSSIGIDVDSPKWSQLYMKMKSTSPLVYAGDHSSIDGRLMNEFIDGFGECANKFYRQFSDYTDEQLQRHEVVRAVLMDELKFCVHAWFNNEVRRWVVYQTLQGNPSGNPMTVLLNTYVNACYMRGAWIDIIRAFKYLTPEQLSSHEFIVSSLNDHTTSMMDFCEAVDENYYGDDNVNAVSERAAFYNQHNISIVLALHGLTFTAATKDDTDNLLMPIEESTYLKRGFKVDARFPLVVHPCMDKITIQELTNWVRRDLDPEAALTDNLVEACKFAYHWGQEYFEQFREQVLRACHVRNVRVLLPTFWDLDEAFVDKFTLGVSLCD